MLRGRLNGLLGGVLLGLVLAAAALGLAHLKGQQDMAPRILMVDGAPGEGITTQEAHAISEMFANLLEGCGKVAVTRIAASALPDEGPIPGATARTFVIRLFPRRAAGGLSLGVALSPGGAFRHRDILRAQPGGPTTPQEAFRQAWRSLPLRLPRERVDLFLPKDAGLFWRLVHLHGEGMRTSRLDASIEEIRQILRQEPDCLEALALMGRLHIVRAYKVRGRRPEGFSDALQALERAVAAPEVHPLACADLVGLRVESGQARLVLDQLLDTLHRCPDSPRLLLATSYAGRTSGLMGLALAASRRYRRISLPEGRPISLDRAFLYAGDLASYEQTLDRNAWSDDPYMLFQRAHLALMHGDRTGAREFFLAASRPREDASPLAGSAALISRAFLELLDGQMDRARELLREDERLRESGAILDGEELVNLVEAYVLLGDIPKGFALAERAFAQGFGCLAWFERNPLLDGLRASPRWPALQQSLRERQEMLQRRFPPRSYTFLER